MRYVDPDGKTIFMIGWASNAGCGTGIAENLGTYLLTDWKGHISVGLYSTSSAGTVFGIGVSSGAEITVAPFANEFSDVEGYSLSAGGSAGIGIFSVGGEIGYNPTAQTLKDKIQSLTLAISGTAGIPGGSPAEGHVYNNYTVKISEIIISDQNKAQEVQKKISEFYSNDDYKQIANYILTISEEINNE